METLRKNTSPTECCCIGPHGHHEQRRRSTPSMCKRTITDRAKDTFKLFSYLEVAPSGSAANALSRLAGSFDSLPWNLVHGDSIMLKR